MAFNTIYVDALLAQLLGVALSLGDLLLTQVDLLNWNSVLGNVYALLVQGDRSLFLTDACVVVRSLVSIDWGALNANLFAGYWNLNGLGVGNNVLTQASLAGCNALLIDVQLLLGTDHFTIVGCNAIAVCSNTITVSINAIASNAVTVYELTVFGVNATVLLGAATLNTLVAGLILEAVNTVVTQNFVLLVWGQGLVSV